DQQVAAGLGNIWRCESLFVEGHSPWTPVSALDDGQLDQLYRTASGLMGAQLGTPRPDFTRWVYDRAGRPCRRCGALVQARLHRQGELARTAYWCPRCQPTP